MPEAAIEKFTYGTAAGASAVWIVRPESRVVEVYHLQGRQEFACGQEIPLPRPLPSGSVPVRDLFLGR